MTTNDVVLLADAHVSFHSRSVEDVPDRRSCSRCTAKGEQTRRRKYQQKNLDYQSLFASYFHVTWQRRRRMRCKNEGKGNNCQQGHESDTNTEERYRRTVGAKRRAKRQRRQRNRRGSRRSRSGLLQSISQTLQINFGAHSSAETPWSVQQTQIRRQSEKGQKSFLLFAFFSSEREVCDCV